MRFSIQNNTSYSNINVLYNITQASKPSLFSRRTEQYSYGMNGQEKDDEVYGAGNLSSAQFWEYDTRLGRRWNRDPIVSSWESPYACFANNPIRYNDVKGNVAGGPGDDKNKPTVKSEPAGTVTETSGAQSPCITCGATVGSGSASAAISPGGAGSQLPNPTNSTSNTLPLYIDNVPNKNVYGSQNLLTAGNSNTSNYYYQVSTAQPGRLDGIDFPTTEISAGYGPVSVNLMTGDVGLTGTNKSGYSLGINPYSIGKGNTQVTANGVSYMGNTVGSTGSTETISYYVMDGKTMILTKVDKTITYNQSSIGFLQANSINVVKTSTPFGGVSTSEVTLDTIINSAGAAGTTLSGASGGFMTPISGKSNLKSKGGNPFIKD